MTIPTSERSRQDNRLGLRYMTVRRPGETLLAAMYVKLWKDDLLQWLWYSDNIPSVTEFLQLCNAKDNVTYLGFVGPADAESLEVAGIGWVQERRHVGFVDQSPVYAGEVSMGFTKVTLGMNPTITAELAEMMLDDCFVHLGYQALYGTTPVENPAAVRFIQKVGFKKLCVAPSFANWHGKPCDCVLSVMTSADWFAPRSTPAPPEKEG